MYAQRIDTSATGFKIMALREEPGFRGTKETNGGTVVTLWDSAAAAQQPGRNSGGRLLNVYRASGRPA